MITIEYAGMEWLKDRAERGVARFEKSLAAGELTPEAVEMLGAETAAKFWQMCDDWGPREFNSHVERELQQRAQAARQAELDKRGVRLSTWNGKKWLRQVVLPEEVEDWAAVPGRIFVRRALAAVGAGREGPMGWELPKLKALEIGEEIAEGKIAKRRVVDNVGEYLVTPHSKRRLAERAREARIVELEGRLRSGAGWIDMAPAADVQATVAELQALKQAQAQK